MLVYGECSLIRTLSAGKRQENLLSWLLSGRPCLVTLLEPPKCHLGQVLVCGNGRQCVLFSSSPGSQEPLAARPSGPIGAQQAAGRREHPTQVQVERVCFLPCTADCITKAGDRKQDSHDSTFGVCKINAGMPQSIWQLYGNTGMVKCTDEQRFWHPELA